MQGSGVSLHGNAILRDRSMIFESENGVAGRVSSIAGLRGEGEKAEQIQAVRDKENRQVFVFRTSILKRCYCNGRAPECFETEQGE